jgi:hypothetical protein
MVGHVERDGHDAKTGEGAEELRLVGVVGFTFLAYFARISLLWTLEFYILSRRQLEIWVIFLSGQCRRFVRSILFYVKILG